MSRSQCVGAGYTVIFRIHAVVYLKCTNIREGTCVQEKNKRKRERHKNSDGGE